MSRHGDAGRMANEMADPLAIISTLVEVMLLAECHGTVALQSDAASAMLTLDFPRLAAAPAT